MTELYDNGVKMGFQKGHKGFRTKESYVEVKEKLRIGVEEFLI